MSDLQIAFSIEDWHTEVRHAESFVHNDADIIAQLSAGKPTGAVAKAALVSRELGLTPPTLLRANKVLTYTGAQLEISRKARAVCHTVQVSDAISYEAPDFVGRVTKEPGAEVEDEEGEHTFAAEVESGAELYEPSYVSHNDIRAVERASKYLREIVPGHILPRLVLLYEHNGDVGPEIDALIVWLREKKKELHKKPTVQASTPV